MSETPTAEQKKPVIFSGMQPTSALMLGNYVGALRRWVELQNTHDCIFSVVDLHALTIRPNPAELRKRTMEVAALYIAAGIDPEKSTVFVQSHVPAHSQLAWVLNCFSTMGECGRMTQYKEKSERHSEMVGLFTYPILMAADILLYNTDLVPVGADQKQHLELARNLAERFNGAYSPTFTVPEPLIPQQGARIMSLQEPTKKMSKSDENAKATIFLTDSADEIRSKIKRAVTDSGTDVRAAEDRPALTNLMTLYTVATGATFEQIEQTFAGRGYADFKAELAEALVELLRPMQQRYAEIVADKTYLENVLRSGAEKAGKRAWKTLSKVYKKVGMVQIQP